MARNVVLVAFQDQDNLGVGYLASALLERGFTPYVVDFRLRPEEILDHVRRRSPILVGFSIIFQYHLAEFRALIGQLRGAGVASHLTAGGHFPTLRWREALALLPGLDSIVRFEGEETLVRLVETLAAGGDWTAIPALAHRGSAQPVANPPEAPSGDLDDLPPPLRQPPREYVLGRKMATLLASRGCTHACAFCSIRRFYAQRAGPVKRVRQPELVAREMRLLADQLGCSVFMFQDDDFPVAGRHGAEWVARFCAALRAEGLADRALWKISCRPDEVSADLFARLRDHGLFLVYLGIEAGTDTGLERMNKRSTVARSLRTVETLRALDIAFDYGFMLFDPWTTREEILEDLRFLRAISADGSSSLTFCKMLPYAETEVERRLRAEGRLLGGPGHEDYDFLTEEVGRVHAMLSDVSAEWLGTRDGVLNASRWLRYAATVLNRAPPAAETSAARALCAASESLVGRANRLLLEAAEEIVAMASGPEDPARWSLLRATVAESHARLRTEMDELRGTIERAGARPRACLRS